MPIRILVNGAFGRMGQMVTKAVEAHDGLLLVGQTGREYDLKQAIADSKADVVVDFTRPQSVFHNALTVIEAGVRPVIGTSGLTKDQIHQLQEKCAELKLGGIIAPNFSLGAVLMIKFAQHIVKYMPQVEVIEMHHDAKVDSPSGTAIRTAEVLAEARGAVDSTEKTSHQTIKGARGATYQGIPIHSIRLPGLLAHEQIIFGSTGETLTLRHDTIDRNCYMPGVLLACEKVMTLDRLMYGLEEIL